ncbi:hypothetical protein HHK36_022641 [Tetracentron sinense]|uniref:very-long-chain 3-oxoacyl-CoA synthase n=1 Tax=Tetracentron sinense TaxID=13715 RepID=A0A835D9U1_TETSI|nr:hypothetical protein HHK36_022641 [Tetracentron sinense]
MREKRQDPEAELVSNQASTRVKNKLPDFLLSVKLKYVKLGYHHLISHAMYLLLIPLLAIVAAHLSTLTFDDFTELWNQLKINLLTVVVCSGLLVFLATLYFMTRPRKVYLVNFACYKPEADRMCTREIFVERSGLTGSFTEENLGFQKKILERSGLGQSTYLPEAVMRIPPNPCMAEARKEAEVVMFGAIDELLAKTGVKAKDIGILVVNCSLFNPTPSLSAMIVNHYKLRGNVLSYSLGGMGCSAGLISIDLAKQLLQVHPNSYALVVSMENITLNWYFGNDRSMLVSNCLFRMGGAAILLSSRRSDRRRSKYQLIHTVRTHRGADDKCYNCVFQEEDTTGRIGVALSKDLMAVAGEALKANITTLGPLVLPMSEQLLFFATLVGRKILKMKIKPYIPDFKLAFEHFCIHAGGRAVLDELEKNLELSEWHMEPSRMTLYRFGNTSSSSLWYELAYTEAKGRIKKGDRAWQIAFGSGFKCNSAVWRALRTVDPAKEESPWMDQIDEFPRTSLRTATLATNAPCSCVTASFAWVVPPASSRPSDRHSPKYQLIDTIHTNTASEDRSYSCIFQEEDSAGFVGVAIMKDLLAIAMATIRTNITILEPLVLPITEQLLFLGNLVARKFPMMKIKPYIPNFRRAFEHLCPYVGGKPVLDELQKTLEFSEWSMEPSRMTLYRFGNTSSSSVWYEAAYSEAKGRIKKGDRMWQIAYGSGFKCSSVVWRAVRTIDPERDEIDEFPIRSTMDEAFPYYFEPSK